MNDKNIIINGGLNLPEEVDESLKLVITHLQSKDPIKLTDEVSQKVQTFFSFKEDMQDYINEVIIEKYGKEIKEQAKKMHDDVNDAEIDIDYIELSVIFYEKKLFSKLSIDKDENIHGEYYDILRKAYYHKSLRTEGNTQVRKHQKYKMLNSMGNVFGYSLIKKDKGIVHEEILGWDKKKKYTFKYALVVNDEYINILKPEDRPVFNAIMTIIINTMCPTDEKSFDGEIFFTINMLHEANIEKRAFKGTKKGDEEIKPAYVKYYVQSLDRMRTQLIQCNYTQAKMFKYGMTEEEAAEEDLKNPIIDIHEGYKWINGHYVKGYYITAMPDLMKIAIMTNRIITIDKEEHALPKGMNATVDNIIMRDYLLLRVKEMAGGGVKSNDILFEQIYNACNLTENIQKKRMRSAIDQEMKHLLKVDTIQGYKINKPGKEYHSITIYTGRGKFKLPEDTSGIVTKNDIMGK